MTKKKISQLVLFLPLLVLVMMVMNGCDWLADITSTKSGSGSTSVTTTTTQDQPAHGQVTYNILEKSPFSGQQLNSTFWTNLDGYCKAGPTQLIIADLDLVPNQMSRAGFPGRTNAQYYAFSRTINGAFYWSEELSQDAELQYLYDNRDKIDAWWDRYIRAIVQIMQKYPKTTAVIIINNTYPDQGGPSVAHGTIWRMSSVSDRVSIGATVEDKIRSNFWKVRSR